jgi:hypothetical protein
MDDFLRKIRIVDNFSGSTIIAIQPEQALRKNGVNSPKAAFLASHLHFARTDRLL